jgi:hypothetical protein
LVNAAWLVNKVRWGIPGGRGFARRFNRFFMLA